MSYHHAAGGLRGRTAASNGSSSVNSKDVNDDGELAAEPSWRPPLAFWQVPAMSVLVVIAAFECAFGASLGVTVLALGFFVLFGIVATGHIMLQSVFAPQPHGEEWRRGCRQCRQLWWDEFWRWRLDRIQSALANGTVPEAPPEGMEWEWGEAVNDTDWFGASAELVQSVILTNVPIQAKEGDILGTTSSFAPMLHIGCGDSPMPMLLHRAGYRNVEHIDISSEVVQLLRKRYPEAQWPGMRFEVRDFLASPFAGGGAPPPANRFVAVIDKAGIYDWLQEEQPEAVPRLFQAVRDALITSNPPAGEDAGVYIVTTKQTPRELQRSLQTANAGFVVDVTVSLTGGIAWAYVLVPT